MTDHTRRATDNIAHSDFSVEKLIAQEDDEKQRTFLLILSSMNKALNENTALTRLIAKQTETHIKEHDEMMAQSRIWVIVGRAAWVGIAATAVWFYGVGKDWTQDIGGRVGTLEARVLKIEDVSRAVKLFEGRRE
jgi:hypothetical protein